MRKPFEPNKTQAKLIAEMQAKSHRRTSATWGYRASINARGIQRYGEQRRKAANALILAGIAREVSREPYTHCRNDYSDHWTELCIELIEQEEP